MTPSRMQQGSLYMMTIDVSCSVVWLNMHILHALPYSVLAVSCILNISMMVLRTIGLSAASGVRLYRRIIHAV
jgi:hypothetical protein